MKVTTEIDYTGLNRMVRDLKNLEKREVAVGYGDEQHDPFSNLTNSELAEIQENGVRNSGSGKPWKIPPRPFMKRGAVLLSGVIGTQATSVVRNTLKNNTSGLNTAMNKIGVLGTEMIQESINQQGFQVLSPITIRIKRDRGSRSTPETQLIDSGQLYDSVTYSIK